MKKLPVKSKEKENKLTKLMEKDQEIFEQVRDLVYSREKEVETFFKGMVKAELNSDPLYDNKYSFYENIGSNPGRLSLSSDHLSEDKARKLTEAYLGSLDNPDKTNSIRISRRQNIGELRLIQLLANYRFRVDPHVRAVTLSIKRYLFGNGIKINLDNPKVEETVSDILSNTSFIKKISDACISSFLDGETGLLIRNRVVGSNKNKKVEFSIQQVYSDEILAVETSDFNTGIKLAYKIGDNKVSGNFGQPKNSKNEYWVADSEYFKNMNSRGNPTSLDWARSEKHSKLKKSECFVFLKFSNDREIRGESQVESILKASRLHEDFVVNRAITNYERSKVLYVHTKKSGSGGKLSPLNVNKTAAPKGGTQLNLYRDESYELLSPNLHAADAERDGLLLLYEIAAGTGTPLSIVSQRLHEANYGAIKNADSPFGQMILDYAIFYIDHITKVIKYILNVLVASGMLPKKVKIKRFVKESIEQEFISKVQNLLKEGLSANDMMDKLPNYEDNMEEVTIDTVNLPVNVIIADSIRPNPLDMAKVWFIYRKMGIVSRQTLSGKAGFIWEQELFRQFSEKQYFEDMADTTSAASGIDGKDGKEDPSSSVGDGTGTDVNDKSGTTEIE